MIILSDLSDTIVDNILLLPLKSLPFRLGDIPGEYFGQTAGWVQSAGSLI